MAEAILDLRLDTVQPNRVRLVYGVQNDYNSRYICARFTVNGKPIDIEKTAVVRINAKRPDGNKDAFPGTVNTDGTAKVPVAQWMLDVPGEVSASITAVTTNGALTTQEFYIMAKASIWDSTGEPSAENPDKDVLQTIIASENERVAAESTRVANENARKSAETARATAETKRIADEATRVANEAGRVSAEEIRREEFATWQDEWGKISSFDKRIENLEAAVSPEIVTPVVDDTVAYQKTVPKGALPNAAITEIGGMSYVKNGAILDSKVEALESVGANVYCGTKVAEHSTGGITYKWDSAQQIITISANTSAAAEVFLPLEEALNIVGGEAYSISAVKLADTSTLPLAIGVCDSRKKYNTSGGYNSLGPISTSKTYTFANDACVDMIHIFVNGSGTVNAKFKYMINKGSTALPFSPYFRESLPIPADELDGFGQGVNAQYCNKIVLDPLEGVKKYVKMVKKIELNGTESISAQNYAAHYTVQQFNILGPSDIKNGINLLCNEATAGWNAFTGNANEIGVSSGYIVIGIPKALLTPYGYVDGTSSTYVSSFKAYLKAKSDSGSPVTIVYALATPVETDVSAYFTDDNLLHVEAGGTITAVNEYEQAVPTSIEYTVKGA